MAGNSGESHRGFQYRFVSLGDVRVIRRAYPDRDLAPFLFASLGEVSPDAAAFFLRENIAFQFSAVLSETLLRNERAIDVLSGVCVHQSQ